jgi:hypothetical protein
MADRIDIPSALNHIESIIQRSKWPLSKEGFKNLLVYISEVLEGDLEFIHRYHDKVLRKQLIHLGYFSTVYPGPERWWR